MDPSSDHQQLQEMSAHSLDMLVCAKSQQQQQQQQDKKPRPNPEQALKCPRCDSSNTKFCYYNNYSLSQPRYFCKACRRYWTKGGTLRNVPVGGGCRKNKRSSSSAKRAQDSNNQPLTPNSNPSSSLISSMGSYDSNDLTLAFARLQRQQSCGGQFGNFDDHDQISVLGNPSGMYHNNSAGFLDALRTGFLETHNGNFNNVYYGFGSGSNHHNSDNNLGEVENNGVCGEIGGGGLLHPFDEMTNSTTAAATMTTMKQEVCNPRDHHHQSEQSGRVLWGFPWQMNGDHHVNSNVDGGECDSAGTGRESWNGINASNWHGLLHSSPLV